jgi:hypothetical protein
MYDPKSYELAEYFLDGESYNTPDARNELAQHIQEAVEEWLSRLPDVA